MTPDLLTLVRRKYAKRHPERDTRAMPIDDTFLAMAEAVEDEFDRMRKRQDRLEARQASKDPE